MGEEKPQTAAQQENSKRKLLRKLVETAQKIISYETGIPFAVSEMTKLIAWLDQQGVKVEFPVFREYWNAAASIPTGKERLLCSREALLNYDKRLHPINLKYHDRIIDACFKIIEFYGDEANKPKIHATK